MSFTHDRVHDRGGALLEHLSGVAVPLGLVVGCIWRGPRRLAENGGGGVPLEGVGVRLLYFPADHGGHPSRPGHGPGPRLLLGPSPLSGPRPPLLAARAARPPYLPYHPGHASWLHGRTRADESRAERAWDGPEGVVSQYRPTCVGLGATAGPRWGQRRARLPTQTQPALSFVEVKGAWWCCAQGARVRRAPRRLRGARSWPAKARLCRGVAPGPVVAPASPARGAGARPEVAVTRGTLVMCWEKGGAACGGAQWPKGARFWPTEATRFAAP